jgi:4-hydroxybenzoate polyprenyltransferase
MPARSQRDVIDYVDDDTQNEDETPFIPVRPDGVPNAWNWFFGGILLGIAGGALVPLAPWLAGLLIFIGYGMTAYSLRQTRNRFAQALSFGFGILALIGGAMFLGRIFFPNTTWSIIAAVADRHSIFISVAIAAWPIGLAKYLYGCSLFRKQTRQRPPGA